MSKIVARLAARPMRLVRAVFQKSSSNVCERPRATDGFARFLREYEAKNKAGAGPENLGGGMRLAH